MLPKDTHHWGVQRNCIRELFEYSMKRKAEIGAENVYDFSIGNPSIPAPARFEEAMREVLALDSVVIHGYTSAAGLPTTRNAIAQYLNSRYGTALSAENIYITCGCTAGLASSLKGLLLPGEETIVFAPFFPEYRVFTECAGGVALPVQPDMNTLEPDLEAFKAALSDRTKVVMLNSPNNPSGVVLSEECIKKIADILREHEAKTGRRVFILSDEPYRELVYDGVEVPCIMNYYADTIICYSFSKCLSIPGERIGYFAVNPDMRDSDDVFASIAGAARCYGYVNAPSLMQRVVEKCMGATADMEKYRTNRDKLVSGLTKIGFECIRPDGAFYLFMKVPGGDAKAFSELAKRFELMLVPSNDFGIDGFVRIAYCVDPNMIDEAMPRFAQLAKVCGIK